MMRVRSFALTGILVMCVCMTLLSACDSPSTSISAQVGYQPPFLPVVFAINNDGTISVSAQGDIVTPIGTFSVAAGGYPIPAGVAPDLTKLSVIIRHNTSKQVEDSVWTITTNDEEVSVTTDGHTQITITSHRVFVDATKSVIRQLIVRDTRPISYSLGDASHLAQTLAWSPDGNDIAVGDAVGAIQIFAALTAKQVRVIKPGGAFLPVELAWSPDGKMLASSSTDHQIYVFDAATGATLQHFPDFSTQALLHASLGWSPNGQYIADALTDITQTAPKLEVFDAHTGKLLVTQATYADNLLCAWSPDGTELASVTSNTGVQIWDAATGHIYYTFPREMGIPCFSHDGQRIAAFDYNSDVVHIFDSLTDAHVATFPGRGTYTAGTWSPDDAYLLTINASSTTNAQQQNGPTAEIWDVQTGSTLVIYQYPYKPYQYNGQTSFELINDAEWAPNGAYVAIVFENHVDLQSGTP